MQTVIKIIKVTPQMSVARNNLILPLWVQGTKNWSTASMHVVKGDKTGFGIG